VDRMEGDKLEYLEGNIVYPVKHKKEDLYYCAKCDFGLIHDGKNKFKYCPNCGGQIQWELVKF